MLNQYGVSPTIIRLNERTGTSAELLGWGIWIANDRFLDRANTPSKQRFLAHVQAQQQARVLEEGKDATGARL